MHVFNSWPMDHIPDWLGGGSADFNRNFEKNLDEVLKLNPVVKGELTTRPLGKDPKFIRQLVKTGLFQRKPEFEKQGENDKVHAAVLKAVTEVLASAHYSHCSGRAAKPGFSANIREFWFPASYFVRGIMPIPRFHFIDEEFFHDEFYGRKEKKHPAIVVQLHDILRYSMVPFTHSRGDGKQEMKIRKEDGTVEIGHATYKFLFKLSASMLDRPGTRDSYGRTISDDDFNMLVAEVKKL